MPLIPPLPKPMIDSDSAMMRRCIALAQTATGRTAPNPLVGCVITQGNEIVGEGFHPKAGEPHAEVFALRAAGDRAKNATAYVSLEPCSHFGRTPPCADALIEAGISRVVVGMVDPDDRVSGRGISRLKEAGIEVIVGVEEAACQVLNEVFIHRVTHKRPFGILKYAMTLDGKIATTEGHSAWVSNTESRAHVHELRAQCDAVIIGTNTVNRDNPSLTCHQAAESAGRDPLRVIMSRSMNLPQDAKLWDVSQIPTLILTEKNAQSELRSSLIQKGIEIIQFDQLTPEIAMKTLYERGCSSVLWECGGTLSAAAIAHQSIQKVMAFIAPKIIGGQGAPSPVGDLGLHKMSQALELQNITYETIGTNLLIQGYLPPSTPSV